MPNHVRNILKFTGDYSEIKNMLEMIQQDDFGIGSIDFNKLIPMPDSLRITSGSDTIKGYKYYRDFVGEMLSANKVKTIDDLKLCVEDENQYLNSHSEIDRDVWNLGKAAFINEYLYGAQTWYEWSIENWLPSGIHTATAITSKIGMKLSNLKQHGQHRILSLKNSHLSFRISDLTTHGQTKTSEITVACVLTKTVRGSAS